MRARRARRAPTDRSRARRRARRAPRPPVPGACARVRASAERSIAVGEGGRLVHRGRRQAIHGSVAYPDEVARLRLAAAQLNLVVGDLDGNAARILDAYEQRRRRRLRPRRVPGARAHRLPARRPAAAAGVRGARAPRRSTSSPPAPAAPRRWSAFPRRRGTSHNAAAVCANGRVQGVYRKHLLPNYAVFDEQRYFAPSTVDGPLFVVGGVRVAITDLRRRMEPDRPDRHAGRGWRRVRREHQRVALLRRPHPRARGDARDARGRRRRCRCCT